MEIEVLNSAIFSEKTTEYDCSNFIPVLKEFSIVLEKWISILLHQVRVFPGQFSLKITTFELHNSGNIQF